MKNQFFGKAENWRWGSQRECVCWGGERAGHACIPLYRVWCLPWLAFSASFILLRNLLEYPSYFCLRRHSSYEFKGFVLAHSPLVINMYLGCEHMSLFALLDFCNLGADCIFIYGF